MKGNRGVKPAGKAINDHRSVQEQRLVTFGVFKNQGDCVSFVATKGKNGAG